MYLTTDGTWDSWNAFLATLPAMDLELIDLIRNDNSTDEPLAFTHREFLDGLAVRYEAFCKYCMAHGTLDVDIDPDDFWDGSTILDCINP